MKELKRMDVLFVGAGPASLAGAIKLKQLLNQDGRQESVVVIDKADKLGQHNMSGAVFEADVLDELISGWREQKDAFVSQVLSNKVQRDEIVILLGQKAAIKLPGLLVPPYLRHKGNYTLSVSEMVRWLAGIARGLGVEIYTGFAATELITENGMVKGIKLGDKGLSTEEGNTLNYTPGEVLEAKVTVLGEGSAGQLAEGLVNSFGLANRNPQIFSLGVKEILRLPENHNFGANRVIHTMGFPNRALTPDVFGGGTLYSMGSNTVAVALILALDWRYCDLDPQRELQLFKSHGFVRKLIQGGEVIAYGAKTLPEGGLYSVPELVTDGALIIGDAAGLTSVKKLKGLHYAIKSGILAAQAIFEAIKKQDFSRSTLRTYQVSLDKSFIMKDLRAARNHRQVFAKAGVAGYYLGIPMSLIQSWFPFRLGTEPDYKGMRKAKLNRQYGDGLDRLTAVNLSGTMHREDESPHITFSDSRKCRLCQEDYGCHPCTFFCPGEVYKFDDKDELSLSPTNCLHCQTCRLKCPHQIIKWQVPEGGEGPRYRLM